MALDPKDYGSYQQRMSVDIHEINIRWSGVPAHEMERILPVIKGVSDALSKSYKVEFSDGAAYIYLRAEFRKTPGPADVLILKSIGNGLLAATSWGGP